MIETYFYPKFKDFLNVLIMEGKSSTVFLEYLPCVKHFCSYWKLVAGDKVMNKAESIRFVFLPLPHIHSPSQQYSFHYYGSLD